MHDDDELGPDIYAQRALSGEDTPARGPVTRTLARPKRIAFFGHFGMGNFGNESTLQAILYHLRLLLPDAEVSCISTGPKETEAIHHIDAILPADTFVRSWQPENAALRILRKACIGVPSEVYRWITCLRKLRRTDMLIIAGTGLLTDAYGLLGWGPYNLFRWSIIAKLCRCKLLFVGVGAGPIRGHVGRWLIRVALNVADLRSYRDPA